ncbi:MAG: hypothetical protein PHN75_07665, partial [Syntrophales bacterium]|nr:hypothetical protein [Syntrophales bacterium]
MNDIKGDHLTDQEKNLIAMGAAMGAGCRTCADKLYKLAVSLRIPEEEMVMAFKLGLTAKAEAVRTMEAKISALMHDDSLQNSVASEVGPHRLSSLVRIASFVAANSAPDVLSEIGKASGQGITPDQIKMSVSLAKMVRKNAMMFSDQEISASDCGCEFDREEICCPLPADK